MVKNLNHKPKFMLIILYISLICLLLVSIYILGFPIWFDILLWVFSIYTLRKKSQIFLTCILIITLAFTLNFISPQDKEIFWRPHEKFVDYETQSYEKNVKSKMTMKHGDLYRLDDAINSNKEYIVEERKITFITDKYGYRNDKYSIDESDLILVGDSFILGNSNSQEYLPANLLSEMSNLKVASIAFPGDPFTYEEIIKRNMNNLKKNGKIIVFYFEGNDFWENKNIPIPTNILIRKKYLHMEINKDRIFRKIYSTNNTFFRKVRRSSHNINKKLFYVDDLSPVQIIKIGNKFVGFHKTYSSRKNETHIINDVVILNRLIAVFFIPSKARTYSNHTNTKLSKKTFNFLRNEYNKMNIPVINLSELFQNEASRQLKDNNYLYWRDDTHWNPLGINIAMECVNNFIEFKSQINSNISDLIKFNC